MNIPVLTLRLLLLRIYSGVFFEIKCKKRKVERGWQKEPLPSPQSCVLCSHNHGSGRGVASPVFVVSQLEDPPCFLECTYDDDPLLCGFDTTLA